MAHIINLSLHSSQILEDMKNARVVPLYKKQSKTEPGNYRPVSILSVTSKILKRIVYNQLEHYLKENNLLYKLQSDFRPSFPTGNCLTFLMDYIRSEMDFGNVITSKTVIRYPGVDLEQTLSGTAIVENILKKGNSRLKFLYRQAKYLNTRSRKLLTSALILCHFNFACSAWYSGL